MRPWLVERHDKKNWCWCVLGNTSVVVTSYPGFGVTHLGVDEVLVLAEYTYAYGHDI